MPEKVMVSENRNIDKPNVYLLIPDAFPPDRSLKNIFEETYEYEYISKLEDFGFTTLKNVRANAAVSYSSIPHFFSMDYFFKSVGPIKSSVNVEMKTYSRAIVLLLLNSEKKL